MDASDVDVDADFMLRRAVATEVAQAFGEQREEDHRALAYSPLAVLLLKMWDATLDRRVCSVCKGLDGQLQVLGIDFVGGTPGAVHPNDRCVSVLAVNRDILKG